MQCPRAPWCVRSIEQRGQQQLERRGEGRHLLCARTVLMKHGTVASDRRLGAVVRDLRVTHVACRAAEAAASRRSGSRAAEREPRGKLDCADR